MSVSPAVHVVSARLRSFFDVVGDIVSAPNVKLVKF